MDFIGLAWDSFCRVLVKLSDIRVDKIEDVWYFIEKHKIDERICAERHTKITPVIGK